MHVLREVFAVVDGHGESGWCCMPTGEGRMRAGGRDEGTKGE